MAVLARSGRSEFEPGHQVVWATIEVTGQLPGCRLLGSARWAARCWVEVPLALKCGAPYPRSGVHSLAGRESRRYGDV